MTHEKRTLFLSNARLVSAAALLLVAVGCESPDRQTRMQHGYVYYCDGAGGGGLMNWSGGLRQGLKDGGYPGAGEIYHWNTGLGVVADQDSSVEYKRDKAQDMARKAAAFSKEHSGAPVTFIGLSAGTAVVVFALEELPGGVRVADAVLCGASISSTYDLTRALRNLDGKMYVYTSERDGVLGFLVPMAGTADREGGDVPSAGLRGFRFPIRGSTDTRQLYAKVVTIPWRPEFAKLGYVGGHTDVLSAPFVAAYITPHLIKEAGLAPAALASTSGKVRNPDYERWAKYGVGTYGVVEGFQEYRGVRSPVRLKATLASKSSDRLVVDREFYLTDHDASIPAQTHRLIAESWIDPRDHPSTDPGTKSADLPDKRETVKGRTITCTGRSLEARGNYPDWGSNLMAKVYRCPDIPGGLAEIELESHFKGEPFKFTGKVVDFKRVSG
jgi:pimeloyl-ACP methyl ester carboxylesterase